MGRRIATAAATTLLVAAGGATAAAATRNGVTPLSPKGTIAVGKQPTFKMRVSGPGAVYVHVCKSRKRDGDGVICTTESIGQARRTKGMFVYKPKLFTYPGFWMQTPGTYYWQAHRIQCEGDLDDCRQEGPIVRIRIR